MINIDQFQEYVLVPALEALGFYSKGAEILLLGTAATESHFEYLHQIKGPALGFYQMEPKTHQDIWINYLKYKEDLFEKVLDVCYLRNIPKPQEMIYNLRYATVMARIHYLRVPAKIPEGLINMSHYYKKYYNTEKGKGSSSKFLNDYRRLITNQGNTEGETDGY